MEFGGVIGLRYVDRGDPDVYDFTEATLVNDDTWRTLDLSAIIPSGVKLVHLRLFELANVDNMYIDIRRVGNANLINVLRLCALHSLVENYTTGIVDCTGQQISYRASTGTITELGIAVLGWFV